MSVFLQPIYTQTAPGNSSEITFNNIPQNFTDLLIVVSARAGIAALSDGIIAKFNGSVSNFSFLSVEGNGSAASSGSSATTANIARTNGSTATANSYASSVIYIPNYSRGNTKQITVSTVSETNATTTFMNFYSIFWNDRSPITSISFPQNSGTNYTSDSTFTIYGVSNIYDTGTPLAPTLGAVTDLGGVASFAFTPNDTATGQTADYYSVQDIAIMGTPAYGNVSPITFPITTGVTYNAPVKAVNVIGTSTSAMSGSLTSYNNFASIATQVITSNTSSIVFRNIPQYYSHLQLRVYARGSTNATSGYPYHIYNGDTSANYSSHFMTGNGITTAAAAYVNSAQPLSMNFPCANSSANIFGYAVIDIMDYTSTNKFKTSRIMNGWDNNSTGNCFVFSHVWNSFAPISSITLVGWDIANFVSGSHVALYGIG